jgi:hypothetical protein
MSASQPLPFMGLATGTGFASVLSQQLRFLTGSQHDGFAGSGRSQQQWEALSTTTQPQGRLSQCPLRLLAIVAEAAHPNAPINWPNTTSAQIATRQARLAIRRLAVVMVKIALSVFVGVTFCYSVG